jgi:hypothetical protein
MVVFDTGSSNLWVPTHNRFLQHHNVYKHDKSNTYHKNGTAFAIQYGSGAVSGVFTEDSVKLGEYTLKDYTFAEATNTGGMGIAYWMAKVCYYSPLTFTLPLCFGVDRGSRVTCPWLKSLCVSLFLSIQIFVTFCLGLRFFGF